MLDAPIEGKLRAPDFLGIRAWLNSKPLALESLGGKVVLVDFWTYTCINCIRTIPYVKKWHKDYAAKGLVVVGVHSPEFDFEKDVANVEAAVKDAGITYPVALDSRMETWSAYGNRYWPAKYLIDRDGYISYVSFGEGNYARTETAIQALLGLKRKAGKKKAGKAAQPDYMFDQSPETYAGFAKSYGLGSGVACDEKGCNVYIDPGTHEMNTIYPHGRWVQESEYLELAQGPGNLSYRFNAREANVVVAPVKDAVKAEVFVGGKKAATLKIDRPRLYNVFTDAKGKYRERELDIVFYGPVRAYAYTFG
jgi:thiol-disulfide isomerase/thioredoxin